DEGGCGQRRSEQGSSWLPFQCARDFFCEQRWNGLAIARSVCHRRVELPCARGGMPFWDHPRSPRFHAMTSYFLVTQRDHSSRYRWVSPDDTDDCRSKSRVHYMKAVVDDR